MARRFVSTAKAWFDALYDDGSRYLMQDVGFATNVGSHVLKAPHHGGHAVDPSNAALITNARQRFKKNLNGMINVRTDGSRIFAARRVNAGFQFETHGPSPAAP